tara:strand:- start:33891 stop:34967 length:1077 start_codon:yes stop_codon:yes gene_type:complete
MGTQNHALLHTNALDDLMHQHGAYFTFIHTHQNIEDITLNDIKNYLRDAFLGVVPVPLNTENLAKSYAYFGGSLQKQTIAKMLSKKELAFNLVPGLNLVTDQNNFNLENFKEFICRDLEALAEEDLKRLVHLHNQKALIALEETFQNPTLVMSALKAVSKKQWGQLLVKAPSNPQLLSSTAKQSSDEFFKNGMHLAFLEIEPEIYGSLTKEALTQTHPTFKAKKHLRAILEFELLLKHMAEKRLNEERYKADAKLYKKSEIEAPLQESEVRHTQTQKNNLSLSEELPKERPSFIQKVVREELGYDIPINRMQVQRILDAADAILKEPSKTNTPIDFLHNKHPEPKEEKITLETMDLSR